MNTGLRAPLIGAGESRVEGKLKVTGGATYAAEFAIPNLAYASLVTSTIARGRIENIDTLAAEKSTGVFAVYTHLNLPRFAHEQNAKSEAEAKKRNLLQDNKIHFNGQPIGLVLAETFEEARAAASLVRISYTEETPALDLEAEAHNAYEPEADPFIAHVRGDVAAGLAQAAAKLEQIYETPMEHHNPIEPHAAIVTWEAPDRLTIYDTTQGVHPVRKRIALLFGLPLENIRVISYFIGGGFGCKGPTWAHVPLAIVAARELKRPIKIVLTRQQMYNATGFRSRTIQKLSFAAKNDGTLTAQRHETLVQTSDFAEYLEPASAPTRIAYSCPNVAISHRLARLNMGTPSYMRSPGEAPGTFALEAAMDELAYQLKVDPIELRLRNFAEKDQQRNVPWSSNMLRECYKVGANKFGWEKRNPQPRATRHGDWLIGYGMAASTKIGGGTTQAAAFARITSEGTALVQAGTQDLGTGNGTVMTQIAADVLGLPMEQVRFELGDSNFPENPLSAGSLTAASSGCAVYAAAKAVLQKLAETAMGDVMSPLHGMDLKNIVANKGRLEVSGDPKKGEAFGEILKRAKLPHVEALAQTPPEEENKPSTEYSFGAQFCEVRVDADLGEVRLNRMLGVFATGRILNAKMARSQLIGGMIFGIGMALTEETVPDLRNGRIVNANLGEYHLPVHADVPDIDVVFLEENDEATNPIGVKGIGELGTTGATAAIVNAIYHATGKRVRKLPVTPDKLI